MDKPDERPIATIRESLLAANEDVYGPEGNRDALDALAELEVTIERQRQVVEAAEAFMAALPPDFREPDGRLTMFHLLDMLEQNRRAALSKNDSGPNLQDPMAAAEMLYEGDSTDDVRAWIDDQEQEHRRTR